MQLTLTIPNCLTLLRILAVPFFAVAVWYGYALQALVIFVLAGLTDLLDGWVARRFNQKSLLGAVLDPAADKLLMTTAFVLLAFPRTHFAVQVPAWVSILAITRDVVISLVALKACTHFDPARFLPTFLGKLTTSIQILVISITLLLNAFPHQAAARVFSPWAFYLLAAMVLASGLQYFFRTIRSRPQAP